MRRSLLVLLLLSGCFDFKKDLAGCHDAGVCGPVAPVITRGSLCTLEGWCWATPTPHNSLNAVVSIEVNNAWAFGAEGTVMRFDGTQWFSVGGLSGDARAALALGPEDLFVSSSGLQHWNGTSWSSTGVIGDFVAIGGASSTDLWLAPLFDVRLIHRIDGRSETVNLPTTSQLRALHAVTTDSVWAVGDDGVVLHWDGSAWTQEAMGLTNKALLALWADPQDVWAVGDFGTILHKANGVWTQLPDVSGDKFQAIAGASGDDLWFSGFGGQYRHWNHGTMEVGQFTNFNNVYGMAAGPAGLFAVGAGGAIQQRVGTSWRPLPDFGTVESLIAVHGTAVDDVWAVGIQGTTVHFDGQTWTYAVAANAGPLSGVFASSKEVVWACSHLGDIQRRVGGAWSVVATASADLHGIWASSESEAWAVGERANEAFVLHKGPGGTSGVPLLGHGKLAAISGSAANDVWAVGNGGAIVHWDGSSWSDVPSGTTAALEAVSVTATDVWVAGGDVLMHREGNGWRTLPAPGNQIAQNLASDGAGGVWFASRSGVAGQVNVDSGGPLSTGTGVSLNGIWSPGPGVAFLVGDEGVILQH